MSNHNAPAAATKAAAYATVIVLDVERATCPQCGRDGLCTPLKRSFREACDVIVAGRVDQAVAA